MKRILVCVDGEPHTVKAEQYAVETAKGLGASITGLYVQSTFLKKFTHEIYAVGRIECREHLDAELRKEGTAALEALERLCEEAGVEFAPKMRQGVIADEIIEEACTGEYDLLVMGAKLLRTWRERVESYNAPADVFKRSPIPMLFVR